MTERTRSILIADDEPGLRDLFHFTLEPMGYEVVTVADGRAARLDLGRCPAVQLLRRNDGSSSVTSDTGEGTVCRIDLPGEARGR